MAAILDSWPRRRYVAGGGRPFVYFAVYGDIDTDAEMSRAAYRSEGVPDGLELSGFDRDGQPEVFARFESGFLWDRLEAEAPALAVEVERAPGCIILRGTPDEDSTLDYLRDSVGLLTFLLDRGGCAVFDPQMLKWWGADEWRRMVFEPAAPVATRHVLTLVTEDEARPGRLWFHTRGMRKFGRPDLSLRNVGAARRDAVLDLFDRFIALFADGAVVADGEEIRIDTLPPGGRAFRRGGPDDPDFNNHYLELAWPDGL